jgi:hypothetical protein
MERRGTTNSINQKEKEENQESMSFHNELEKIKKLQNILLKQIKIVFKDYFDDLNRKINQLSRRDRSSSNIAAQNTNRTDMSTYRSNHPSPS